MRRTGSIRFLTWGMAWLAWCGSPPTAIGATLRVPSEYATIQDAIDVAFSGDEVLVAPGTYSDYEVRIIEGFPFTACVYMKDGVAVRSEIGPEGTTIDGGSIIGFQPAVMYAWGTESLETEVEGFTITTTGTLLRGIYTLGALAVHNCRFSDLESPGSSGGGIAANGDLRTYDCMFEQCQGNSGGAIYHANGTIEMYACMIIDCGNLGVFLEGNNDVPLETAWIEDCWFENCGDSGALGMDYSTSNSATVLNSVFVSNRDYNTGGGAIGITGPGQKLIEGCLFVGNEAGTYGGALDVRGPIVIRNNTFWENSAPFDEGGTAIAFKGGSTGVQLMNNVIAGGIGPGGSIFAYNTQYTSSCNVFWANPGDYGDYFEPGPTDREVDPLICDPEDGDFTVNISSPCLPENSLGCGLIGAFGVGCGSISVEKATWGKIKGMYRVSEEGSK